jgi:FKBP-type peptidyl-prolyl cis-trans isomerase FkpA
MRRLSLLLATLCLPTVAGAEPPSQPPAELVVTDLAEGQGDAIAAGSTAVVHYTGWLFDAAAEDGKGQKFDSSVDRGQPFRFPLGAGRVIGGWDQGVAGMKVGGQRRLLIPPQLGYGSHGAGNVIPPNATLVFDVELLGIE